MGKHNKQFTGKKKTNNDRRRHRDDKFDVDKCNRDFASCQISKISSNYTITGACVEKHY